MSEVFNFRRFGSYAARNYGLNRTKYLVQAGLLSGAMILVLLAVRVALGEKFGAEDVRALGDFYFSFILSVSVVIFVVSVMKPFKSRHTLVIENTVPASPTEKFLFVLLNTTVMFFALFLLAFFITALFGIAVTGKGTLNDYFYNFSGTTLWLILWLRLFPLQAAAMYAGTMERRNHMLSFLLVAAAVVASAALLIAPPLLITEHYDTVVNYGPMFVFDGGGADSQHAMVRYFDYWGGDYGSFPIFLSMAGTLVFWVAAWFNFRERSIK